MYLLAGIILAIGLVSCEKQKVNPKEDLVGGGDAVTKAQPVSITEPEASMPATSLATPYLIPGKNRGGNRTCEEAKAAFDIMAADQSSDFYESTLGEFTDCGEKVDIGDDYVGDVEGFPFDVWVNDDGSIGFASGDRECLVKAVIVKGSNVANVYYYPGGILSDDGLSAPAFENGNIPWVSNVTFCCVCEEEEEPEDEIFAVKVWYNAVGEACEVGSWALSAGTLYPYKLVDGWCDVFGFNVYENTEGTPIDLGGVGEIAVVDGDVIITMDQGYIIYAASVYVGDGEDLIFTDCPAYKLDPWNYLADICADNHTFDYPPFD
jgi:hypothetical protein